jgi:hypothetical protein
MLKLVFTFPVKHRMLHFTLVFRKVDMWGLGAMVLEMLLGHKPFDEVWLVVCAENVVARCNALQRTVHHYHILSFTAGRPDRLDAGAVPARTQV